jgi:hypothetical protein
MNYTKEQLEKLPKWAQSEINRLERLTKTLNQRLAEFNGEAETNTHLLDGLDRLPLMNNAIIEFSIGDNKLNRVVVYIRKDGVIDINSDSRLGEQLVILPRASNSFYLTFIDK